MELSKQLLSTIHLVQSYKQFMINQSIFNEDMGINDHNDWYRATQRYYNNLPNEALKSIGLKKNIDNFNKVISYVITEEMNNCKSSELGKFKF